MADWKQLYETSQARNRAVYGWLRWLVLLAAGFFSVMAAQVFGKPAAVSLPWVKAAFLLNAAGILCGAAALHGEVYALRLLVRQQGEDIAENIRAGIPSTKRATYVAPVAAIHTAAEYACYAALAISLVCWCVVVWEI